MEANKNIFKVGDKVYLYPLGWGDIQYESDYDYSIYFESIEAVRYIGGDVRKLLSFTEYTLEGFSQDRPEELPKVGQVVWTRGEFPSEWEIGHFFEKKGNEYRTYMSPSLKGWNNKGIEIRTTNPYEDEHTKEDEETMVGNK